MKKRPVIHYILDEYNEANSEWMKQQSQWNNSTISGATVMYLLWQIVSHMWVHLQYQ
jgi:hypothetical protein